MSRPIENCPKYTAEQVERSADGMRVRSGNELEVERMLRAYAATLRQQGDQAGGVVSEEVEQIAWRAFRRSAGEMLDGSCFADKGDIRAALEAVAPLLRAPGGQGGRVDDVILREAADEALTLLQQLDPQHGITTQLQAALAQNTQGNADFSMTFGSCTVTGRKDDVLLVEKIIGEPDEPHAERTSLPEEVINRAVFSTIVSCMESDNGCEFAVERGDFTRAMQSIADLRAAGFFADDPNDLDSDYWYACGGHDEDDAKEHFSRVAEAYAPLNEVLQEIFDRPLPDAERARVPAVTFDMVKKAEFFCPTDLPTLKRLRWKAKRLTELLAAAPSQPEDAA